jgi:hypothetical protein
MYLVRWHKKQPTNLIINTNIVSNAREWVTRTFFGLKIGEKCFEAAPCLPVPRTSHVYSAQISGSLRDVMRTVTTRQRGARRDAVHKNSLFAKFRTVNAISFVPVRNAPPSLRRFQNNSQIFKTLLADLWIQGFHSNQKQKWKARMGIPLRASVKCALHCENKYSILHVIQIWQTMYVTEVN